SRSSRPRARKPANGYWSIWATSSSTSCSRPFASTTLWKRSGAASQYGSSSCPERRDAVKLIIVAVGNRMPSWVQEAFADYAKRLPADAAIELREGKPEARTTGKTPTQMMALEARRIEAALPSGCLRVALDEHGRDLTTMALSGWMDEWRTDGRDVAFIIGGADGLDAELKRSCDRLMRLSSLTLPHAMVRVLLAEQLYRAWAILHNHPYHRA